MPSRHYTQSRSGSKDGVALLFVLAFIVLLTLLVLAFTAFSRLNRTSTASYGTSVQAQEIAEGGLQDVLDDLHQEIQAGSTVSTVGSGSYATIYIPTTNFTAVPARIGFSAGSWGTDTTPTTLSPTLIRVSRATNNPSAVGGDTFFTSPPSYYNMANVPGGKILDRASLACTTNSSANARTISMARWNKPFLLATNSATVPTPFTGAPPDWVYVTRNGSRTCTQNELTSGQLSASNNVAASYGTVTPGVVPPAAPIVGRYAFVVYDEGALLDANVAGYVSTALAMYSTNTVNNPAGVTQAVYGKSYSAYADLTQLPGLYNGTTPLQSQVDAFVNGRNGSAATTAGGAISGVNYLNTVFSYGQSGFLTFVSNSSTGASDRPLVSRQDLINYFANIDPNINTSGASYSQALPYLGTFTRAMNAPTWQPTLDSSQMLGYQALSGTSPVLYKTNAETALTANRDLANLRWPTATTINHYNDSGVVTTYSVNVGDPYLQHRFSLARFNWLTHTGVATGITAQAVKDCFGLVWGHDNYVAPSGDPAGPHPCWVYNVHGTGTAPNHILTLDKVAAQNREPDFFELLKAAILSGSLGRDPGSVALYNTVTYPYQWEPQGPGGIGFDTLSSIPDQQIMKIGVDIIDQWHADSYPTAIYFQGNSSTITDTSGSTFMVNMVYGAKNLPYLNRLFHTSLYNPSTGMYNAWYLPELWDPFQTPTVTTNRPKYFDITAHSNVQFAWTCNSDGAAATSASWKYDLTNVGDASVYFHDLITPSAFANPQVLSTVNGGPGTDGPGGVTPAINIAPTSPPGDSNVPTFPFLGIHAGQTTYSFSMTNTGVGTNGTNVWDDGVSFVDCSMQPNLANGVGFVLQYWDGTSWLPYSFISHMEDDGLGFDYRLAGTGTPTDPIYGATGPQTAIAHIDPLTDRFSTTFNDGSHGSAIGWSDGHDLNAPNQTWQYQNEIPGGPNPWGGVGAQYGAPRPSSGFIYYCAGASTPSYPTSDIWELGYWLGNFAQNNLSVSNSQNYAYYADPDGVVRPGNDWHWNPGNNNTAGYVNSDGMGQVLGGYSTTTGTGSAPTTTVGRRPLILNRPFRSVGEMGYAYRDEPYKSIDFSSPYSADAALLDVFSLVDEPVMSAGQLSVSNAPAPVIQAILAGTNKEELDPTYLMTTADAKGVAAKITSLLNQTTGANPLLNRAELVTKLMDPNLGIPAGFTASADMSDKTYMEAPIRALSDITNTRTWNLMIDIIAQSGQMSPAASTLNDFVVQGERRYWLHIAIDRYTGKIIDQQLEPVYE